MTVIDAMKKYLAAGIGVIPVKGKIPSIDWKPLQERLATESEIKAWGSPDGVGIVCGKVSGGLTCIDIDTKNDPTETMAKEFFDLLVSMGTDELSKSFVVQKTPSAGYHIIFRCPEICDGNQIFAKSDITKKAVIETRGQGGQFVAFPSSGYTIIRGALEDVKTISRSDAEIIFSAARAIDRSPLINHTEVKPPTSTRSTQDELTPIDDYNLKTTAESMQAEIESAGFTKIRERGENIHYHRPGKTGRDTSATLHTGLKKFYVFSTSTDFEAGKAYSPAALICFLHNGGDWSATAKNLRLAGYGSQRENKKSAALPAASAQESGAIIITRADIKANVSSLYRRPYDPGKSTGWECVDKFLRIRKKRLNIITGAPGSGKSSFTNHLFMNLAFNVGWKVAIWSPESESPEDLVANLCEIKVGKPFFGIGRMTEAEAIEASNEISEKFTIITQSIEGISFDDILKSAIDIKPDVLLLDPWNRMTHTRPDGVTETEYIGSCLAKGAEFAKAHDLSLWIVAHPQKLRRDKNGEVMRPGLYDISGSANWANMADNAMMLWRDYDNGSTELEIIKVRGKRDGEPGTVRLKFIKETGRFRGWEDSDEFEVKPVKNKTSYADSNHATPKGDWNE